MDQSIRFTSGTNDEPLPQRVKFHPDIFQWFKSFLAEELRPYPGRFALVSRMVLSATITMLLIMVFHIPGGAKAAYLTLLVSRQSPKSAVQSAAKTFLWSVAAGLYCLLGVMLFLGNPLVHFLWVLVSIALCFFAIKKLPPASAGSFASTVMAVIPLWDTTAPTAALVGHTLWAAGSILVGLIVTVFVEYFFSLFSNKDELLSGIVERLEAFGNLQCAYADRQDTARAIRKVQELTIVGVSRLRRMIPTEGQENARWSTIVSLTGRLIDISAAMIETQQDFTSADRERMRRLSQAIPVLEAAVQQKSFTEGLPARPPASEGLPVITEIERVADILALSLSPQWQHDENQPKASSGIPPNFSPEGHTSTGHVGFVLRGTLAASLCYVIMNAIAWPGISTCLVTCAITALISVGASRQKQILRITGAIAGGVVFGIGSQIFVIPALDTISGFATLFVLVTFIAAWVATSTPRLSYFGLQLVLAFYIIHIQEFSPQIDPTTGRDRVMGIALGLLAMWLVFDTLGSASAVRVMRDTFARNLQLLAELAMPWRDGQSADQRILRSTRDQINRNFAQVDAQADAVLFEIGPSRNQKLALRQRLLDLQPTLRSIFFVEVALLQYRITMHPGELDAAVFEAQQAFNEHASIILRRFAKVFMSGEAVGLTEGMEPYHQRLELAVKKQTTTRPERTQVLLTLLSRLSTLIDDLRTGHSNLQMGESNI